MHRSWFLSCYRIARHFAVVCGLLCLSLRLFAQTSTTAPAQSTPTTLPDPGKQVTPVKPAKPVPPAKPPTVDRARDILRADHAQLFRGKLEFRNVGANIPDLFERYLSGDDTGAEKMLTDAQTAGVRFARCFGTTWGPAQFGLFTTDRARWLSAFDRMLLAADKHGIAVVPSLLFNIRMLPDYVQRTTGKQEGVVGFLTPGSVSNGLAITYVTAIVTRYRNDPRVLFWEIGNEYNLEADLSLQWKSRPVNEVPTSEQIRAFLAQIATVIKKVDPRHLVTSGNADMRPAAWHLREAMRTHKTAADPLNYPMDWTKDTLDQYIEMIAFFSPKPLDIVSVHQYAPDPQSPDASGVSWLLPDHDHAVLLSWARVASQNLNQPLFVGEFGETFVKDGKALPALWTQDFMTRIPLGTAPLAAVWAWEFAQDGKMTPNTLTPDTTPGLVGLLTTTNRTILNDIIGASIVVPPPK
ncbi:MAG: putative glycosyl hydrolase [Chthonomonadaceae bacterium]|nr:putative glycosyl hydrolase [Chthonomonadaceae bacterium]